MTVPRLLPFVALAALVPVTSGCHSLPPPTPLSQLNPQQALGHAAFEGKCGACHNDRTTGARNGPSLLGLYKKPILPSGAAATDERVMATILHGRNNMPSIANQLEPGDLEDIVAYLHTL